MITTQIARLLERQSKPHATELWKALLPLKSVTSFMNTGAHPDDETSEMIAAIGFRDGVKLSHACSTRGEGGQNAIGTQTGVELGVIRTREMERSAQVLDMKQYWLCQYPGDPLADFGFSKSGEETLENWGKTRTLERFVSVIRTERPDMIAPTFLDVPGQHGHHRAMTQSAFEVVKLAADPKAFPEQNLAPWQVKKVYLPAWSGAGDAYDDDLPPPPATVHIKGSGADPVLGLDYTQWGQVSRSFHKTQGMGHWVEPGKTANWPLNLAWAAKGFEGDENSIFDRLPKTLADLASFANAPDLEALLGYAQSEIDATINAWPNSELVLKHSAAALNLVRQAINTCPTASADEVLHRLVAKQDQLQRAVFIASKIYARFELSDDEARPGQVIEANIFTSSDLPLKTTICTPNSWEVQSPNAKTTSIQIPLDAEPSDPLPDIWSPYEANSDIFAKLEFSIHGENIKVEIAPEQRFNIAPSAEIELDRQALIFNLTAPATQEIEIAHTYPNGAKVDIACPSEFTADINAKAVAFSLSAQTQPGRYSASINLNDISASTVQRMDFPHTGKMLFASPADIDLLALEVNLPTGKIGYIGGGSDKSDFWLRQVGIDIHAISDDQIAKSAFDSYDSILVGVFALRTRPELAANLKALHQWVQNGGNLVTLYHRPWDNWDEKGTALAPITIGKPSLRWRVTNQNAPVTVLQPEHTLIDGLNKISEADWSNWHKERGLYFASSWDDAYTPILSMSDEGEYPLLGSLLSGNFGKGRHTHTSLILHHQLDKLVPGAYRLMANLLQPVR
ncbi:PIG-L family deacetylase [Maritalea sp.]|uniref:PIG-L family deacetylase n=1 Tax=Maritalea sp. TaxID=2003361 RepID=UPI003EFB0D40